MTEEARVPIYNQGVQESISKFAAGGDTLNATTVSLELASGGL